MPGSERLRDNNILKRITQTQAANKRLVGGISTAPAIALETWGILRGLKVGCNLMDFVIGCNDVHIGNKVFTNLDGVSC